MNEDQQKEKYPDVTIQQLLLSILRKAVEQKWVMGLQTVDGVFKTYDDSTGQRQAYISYYGAGEGHAVGFPVSFKIKRHLTFTNRGDEGKEGAVLGTLSLGDGFFDNSKLHIRIDPYSIEIGTIRLSFKDNIFL